MPVKLRLTRMGSKKKPFYRIVAIDSHAKRDGKYIDCVGTYNPVTKPMSLHIDETKVENWLEKGAQVSPTVKNLLSKVSFWEKSQLKDKGLDEDQIKETVSGKEKKLETSKKKKKSDTKE